MVPNANDCRGFAYEPDRTSPPHVRLLQNEPGTVWGRDAPRPSALRFRTSERLSSLIDSTGDSAPQLCPTRRGLPPAATDASIAPMGTDDLQARVLELEAEARVLQTMLQNAPNFITRITPDGKFLYLNRLAPGFRMEDVIGTSVDAYVPEPFRDRAHAALRAAIETRSVQQYATVGQISKDKIGHYLTRVSPVIEGEEVTSMMMIATDVTMLEEERVQLQVARDAGGLGIWTCSFPEQKLHWDPQTCRIFGVSQDAPAISTEELLSKHVHADDRELLASAIEQARTTGTYGPLQHRIVRPTGEVRWVSASGLAVRDNEGNIVTFVGSTQDVTERRVLEERLVEAQRLESIGRLAGGVAHDFNNMLTATFGNLEFLDEAESLDEVRSLLDAVRVTAERSAPHDASAAASVDVMP